MSEKTEDGNAAMRNVMILLTFLILTIDCQDRALQDSADDNPFIGIWNAETYNGTPLFNYSWSFGSADTLVVKAMDNAPGRAADFSVEPGYDLYTFVRQ